MVCAVSLCLCLYAEPCDLNCPNGFRRDLLGLEVCECAGDPVSTSISQSPSLTRPALPTCPPLIGCTKDCFYGYRSDRYGCRRCRCNRCPPFNCAKKCRHGFAYSSDGCKLCRCLGLLSYFYGRWIFAGKVIVGLAVQTHRISLPWNNFRFATKVY